MAANSPEPRNDAWPDCTSEQIPVLLLGTYHMDDPGLDKANVEADDVLSDQRQSELSDLTERLAEWNPTKVAVERPYERSDDVNVLYREYRSGDRSYSEVETFDPPHPYRDELDTECRSEVVQIGFRLAELVDLNRVHPVDYPMRLANDDAEELEQQDFEPDRKTASTVRDSETVERELTEQLAESTLVEYHRWINQEKQLRFNHEGMFDQLIPFGTGENFGGPKMLATWFDRNLRIVHNLWRAVQSDGDRILLVIGSGHVRILRYLLDESPMFCPKSALKCL